MIKKVSDRLNSELRANNLKGILNDNTDVVIRNIFLADIKSCLVFIDGLSDLEQINLNIINPLKKITKFDFKNLKQIADLNANFCNFEVVEDLKTMQLNILKGQAVLFVDGFKGAICFNVIKYESRGIVEPPSSTVINGPREGFNESIKTNISLIRKRLASTSLKIEDMQVGLRTNTAIKIVYFDDLADKSVVEQVKNKISKIKIDGIIDSYYISKFLEKYPNSMFRQIGSCEKPDIVCAKLLEGRVAIFVDGSPIVLTVPFVFIEDFQSANDYYSDAYRASFLRILRLFAFCVSIYLPGMYMALQ